MELFIIPVLFAVISLVTPRNIVRYVALAGALASVAVVAAHVFYYFPSEHYVSLIDPHWMSSFGLTYKMGYDGMGLFMVLLTNAITLIILLSNYNRELAQNRLFNAMVFFMQFGLLGVFTAMDGLMFYIFWEITLIPVFLIALWFGAPERKVILIKFFLYTFLGSLAMLVALMYIGNYASSFAIGDLMAVELSAKAAFWVFGGFFLAFAIKIPLFPLHTWQPGTYTISPMAGTMLLSALMLKMALYGMVRWMIPLAPEALSCMTWPIIIMAVIGIVYAAIIAIKQNDIKRLFAFASISHVGLIAAGAILFEKDALSGVFLQMANHSLVAVGLFLSADILERNLGTRALNEMGGIAKLAPKFAFWFAVIAFASVSVPLTSGFIGEFILLRELYSFDWIVGLLCGTTLVFGAVYTLRSYQLSMYGTPKVVSFPDLAWNEWLVYFLLVAGILFLGIYPQAVIDFVGPSVDKLLETVQASNTLVP